MSSPRQLFSHKVSKEIDCSDPAPAKITSDRYHSSTATLKGSIVAFSRTVFVVSVSYGPQPVIIDNFKICIYP